MPFAEFAGDNSRLMHSTPSVLPEEYYDEIANMRGRRTEFSAGANLFTQGSMGSEDDTFYVIVRGAVYIVRVGEDGTEEIQTRVGGRGAIVGEVRALNLAIPRTRTVRAAEDVVAIGIHHHDLRQWNGGERPWGEIHAFITDLARSRLESLSEADRQKFGLDDHQWGGYGSTNIPIQPVEEISPPPTSIIPRLPERGALARRIDRGPLPSLDPPQPPIWFRSSHRPRK